VAEDDVLDRVGGDPGAVEQALQGGDTEVYGVEGLEHSTVATDGGADGLADDDFAHDDLRERRGIVKETVRQGLT
jgi:hypothetical protein